MKFLVLSDIHGNLENLDQLDNQFTVADAVIFAGDFAALNKPETALPVLEKLLNKHDVIYSVLGNCDEPNFLDKIEENDISVESAVAFQNGLAFTGAGGGLKFTGDTPFERTEDEIMHDLHIITDHISVKVTDDGIVNDSGNKDSIDEQKWSNLIAIVHQPPKNTKCDCIEGGVHVGSQKLRDFIDNYKPLAFITGHIHESAAVETVGSTVCINPGSLAEGKYAILEVAKIDGNWKVTKAELQKI
ncbi:MAG: serine/threonine protein phosphatase [Treponema sp. CETP13]|nr:MAG: serine/threonine protein phosphatase [Treponema sp. CETP13]